MIQFTSSHMLKLLQAWEDGEFLTERGQALSHDCLLPGNDAPGGPREQLAAIEQLFDRWNIAREAVRNAPESPEAWDELLVIQADALRTAVSDLLHLELEGVGKENGVMGSGPDVEDQL